MLYAIGAAILVAVVAGLCLRQRFGRDRRGPGGGAGRGRQQF